MVTEEQEDPFPLSDPIMFQMRLQQGIIDKCKSLPTAKQIYASLLWLPRAALESIRKTHRTLKSSGHAYVAAIVHCLCTINTIHVAFFIAATPAETENVDFTNWASEYKR